MGHSDAFCDFFRKVFVTSLEHSRKLKHMDLVYYRSYPMFEFFLSKLSLTDVTETRTKTILATVIVKWASKNG
jgi:hypothetical protein